MSEPQATAIEPASPTAARGPAPARRPAPKGWPPFAAILLAAGVVVVAGFGYYFLLGPGRAAGGGEAGEGRNSPIANEGGSETEGERAAAAKSAPRGGLPVEVAHPRTGGIVRTTTQPGSVHAFEHARLFAKVSGYLKVQNVDIGDRVKVGELLAVIDDPEVDKAVDQNKAALDQAMAMVRVADAKIRSAQAAQAAAQAMVAQADTDVVAKASNQELQRKQLARIEDLVRRNAIEQKLADEQKDRADVATSDLAMARAAVLTARAQVEDKAAKVSEAEADRVEADASVEVARANLSKAEVMQDYTRITSPYDGVITVRSYHKGDFIRSASEGGSVPVLAVARTDLMRVVLPVPDIEVPYVDKGDEAIFHVVALPGRTFRGKVCRYSETEDPTSRNMRTEVDLENKDGPLREGMYGDMTLILQAASARSVTIPSSGLVDHAGQGKGHVMLARDGKARRVEVEVGRDNGVDAEILQGLTTADLVITSYNGSVEDGTPIKPAPPGPAAAAEKSR